MIKMAHQLNMQVVAEGVETEEELLFLRGENCDQIQGFLFSKPLPIHEFERLMLKGKLSPIFPVNKVIENKRNYFRIELESPLAADMTIAKIRNRVVEVGKSEVLIEDIGPGGLRFLSSVKLVVHPQIIFSFETQIVGETIQLFGRIVWNKEWDEGVYQYGVEFEIPEIQRTHLIKTLNEFSLQLRKTAFVPDCRFIRISIGNFFKLQENH